MDRWAGPPSTNVLVSTRLNPTHNNKTSTNSQGTPGGDIAEVAGGVVVYFNLTNTAPMYEAVKQILHSFMDSPIITSERPLYFHTSDEKLVKIFQHLAEEGVTPAPVAFPET